MPRRLGSKELVSPLMDEGPPVTGKTDGEEDPGVSPVLPFTAPLPGTPFTFPKDPPGQGTHLGLGGVGDSSLGSGGLKHPWIQGSSIISPSHVSLAGD